MDPARRQIFGNASAEKCIPVLRVCHKLLGDPNIWSGSNTRGSSIFEKYVGVFIANIEVEKELKFHFPRLSQIPSSSSPQKHVCNIMTVCLLLLGFLGSLTVFFTDSDVAILIEVGPCGVIRCDSISYISHTPVNEWVSRSVSEWVMFSEFRDSYRIYRACELIIVSLAL